MKRDMELVKKLLNASCDQKKYGEFEMYTDDDFDCPSGSEMVRYHIQLLDEGGFVKASFTRGGSGIIRLTNKGHDLHEFLNNQGIMNKIKEHVKKFPELSLGMIYSVAVQFGTDRLSSLLNRITG